MKKIIAILVLIVILLASFASYRMNQKREILREYFKDIELAEKRQSDLKASNDPYLVFGLPNNLEIVTRNANFSIEAETLFLPKEVSDELPKQLQKMDKFKRLTHGNITLYGKFVDQFDSPLPNVQLRLIVGRSGASGVSVFTQTDSQGRFHLTGVVGSSVKISGAEKEGYVFNGISETYGPMFKRLNSTFDEPYLFKAWKIIEEPTVLKGWSASITDVPSKFYTVDLKRDETKNDYHNKYKFREGTDGDIVIKVERAYQNDREIGDFYDIDIAFKNGLGVVKEKEKFQPYPYLAPESGYKPFIRKSWNFQTHSSQSHRYGGLFYIKGINGKDYGILNVHVNPFWRKETVSLSMRVKYNDSGSRNLFTDKAYQDNLMDNKWAYPQSPKSRFYREDKDFKNNR